MHNLLRTGGLLIIAALLLVASATRAADAPQAEIVVAMRYLQQTGTSHAHLYLYRADGKLLRQLTDDSKGQDYRPIFAPDGETIVFTRLPEGGSAQYFSIEPRGGNLRQLPAAPDWYANTKESPCFNALYPDPDEDPSSGHDMPQPSKALADRAPADSVVLTIKLPPDGEDRSIDVEAQDQNCVLRDLKSNKTFLLGEVPGYADKALLMATSEDKAHPFLFAPGLRVVFLSIPTGSQEGADDFVFDLDHKRVARLSFNGATPYPLPGEAAFLSLNSRRYLPFGDGKRTADCFYVERWDAKLQMVRYTEGKDKAGICYGASMYRPGKDPATINITAVEP